MRWGQHWKIGRDVLWSRKSIAFQLGTILPDWFERHPIHRVKESYDNILNRIDIALQMPAGIRRDFMVGTIAHFVVDYCCYAHSDVYYDLIRHRIYEVKSQKKYNREHSLKYETYMEMMPNLFEEFKHNKFDEDSSQNHKYDVDDIEAFINKYVAELLRMIELQNSKEWSRDENVMEFDTQYSYMVLYGVMSMLGEPEL